MIIKKSVFALAALATIGMASCSNEEEVAVSGNEAIAFNNSFIDNSTRSVSDPSFSTAGKMFDDFAVFGFVEGASLFDGIQVSKTITNTDLTSDWKYAGTQYWIAGANYNFAAVAPMTNGGWTKTACSVTDGAVNTALSFTNDGTTDLLYADAGQIQGKVSDNEQVEFSFRHLLSKVKFSFSNEYNATNATIRVRNVKITNAYATGNAALTASATTWSDQTGMLELNFGNAAVSAIDAEETIDYTAELESYNELLLIPGAITGETAGYNVTFTVDLLISGTKVTEYAHNVYVDFTPEAGNSYDITATINPENIDPENSQEPIEFTVKEIGTWTPGTNPTIQ